MTKQLVVVVHGVGVKEAGVSSDLLATALDDGSLLPDASDDFHINEKDIYAEDFKRKIFPCRIRRYKGNGDERVIADFYWGDISNSGSGALGLLIAIVKTVLGIGHVVRENAKEIYGQGSPLARIADWIVRLIHGPIAAINLVMLSGLGVYWLADFAGDEKKPAGISGFIGNHAGMITALALLVPAALGYRKHQSYLGRHLWGWTVAGCLLLFASETANYSAAGKNLLAIPDAKVSDFLCLGIRENLVLASAVENQSLCRNVAQSCAAPERSCGEYVTSGIFISGGRLLLVANSLWLLVIGLNIVLITGTALLNIRGKLPDIPYLAPVAASGMTFLWMLFLTCVWTAPSAAGLKLLPHPKMLESGLNIASAVAVILVALLLVAIIGIIQKTLWSKRAGKTTNLDELKRWYFERASGEGSGQGISEAASHRLIVASGFAMVFLIGMFFLAYFALALLIHLVHPSPNSWADERVEFLYYYSAKALWALGIIGVGVFGWFRTELKAGIDILTDVITYLNDYYWTVGAPGRSAAKPTATLFALERLPGRIGKFFERKAEGRSIGPNANGSQGYYPRERIKDRLKELLRKLLREENPDELFVVSHSQGTVIALDVIKDATDANLKEDKTYKPSCPVSLVTMGSPWTHIHGFYFPSSFPPVKKGDTMLSTWDNIFRIDDFVGTHVDPEGKWPVEHPVPPNGHTYYWIDTNVAPILKNVLNFGSGKPANKRVGGKGKR